jgi:hypothetical protein
MTNNPMLSIGQFCDDGYDATFTSDAVLLSKQGHTFSIGTHNPINGLWTADLSNTTKTKSLGFPNLPTPPPAACQQRTKYENTSQPCAIFDRACFSPVIKLGCKLSMLVSSPLGLDSLSHSFASIFQSLLPLKKVTCDKTKKMCNLTRQQPTNPSLNHLLWWHRISSPSPVSEPIVPSQKLFQ